MQGEQQYTLRQARRLSEKTQREVAAAIGVCQHTYIRIEKEPERATIKQGEQISNFLGIPRDAIYFGRNSN